MLAQPGPFRERLVLFLLPYFLAVTSDFEVARAEVLETLASYGARTRSELISAARIIAFSFSALDTLYEAKATDMTPSMRLRFNGCANGLNRSCHQNEQLLAKRLACDLPGVTIAASEPADAMPEAEFEAAIQQAQAHIATYRNRLSAAPPRSRTERHTNDQPMGSAILNALTATTAHPAPPPDCR